ncbi:MAG: hypothetical protein RL264_1205 [Bacteroidota bacterium]|jgi:hypothetical protein
MSFVRLSKTKTMKKIKIITLPILALLLLIGCTNYEPKVYGPVEFEIELEGPFFKDGVCEGITTIQFKPEDFGIERSEIFSMKMNEIVLETDAVDGFSTFENLVFSVMTDKTETKEVATIKIKKNSKKLVIKGLQEAEIEGFKDINKFYFEVTGITKKDSFDKIKLKGTIKMDIMIPDKK